MTQTHPLIPIHPSEVDDLVFVKSDELVEVSDRIASFSLSHLIQVYIYILHVFIQSILFKLSLEPKLEGVDWMFYEFVSLLSILLL